MKTKLFWAAALGFVFLAGAPAIALEGTALTWPAAEKKPAAAPDAVQTPPETPAAAKAGRLPRYLEETLQTMTYLSAMLAKQDRLEPEKLEETLKDIARLNEKLKTLLGPEIIKELEAEEKELLYKEQGTAAKLSLAETRTALQIYYSDHNGSFPKDLGGLIPGYLKSIQELQLPGHGKTGKVTVIDSKNYGDGLASAVTDSGGWLYFSNPDSINSGMLVIDCSHKAAGESLEWYKY